MDTGPWGYTLALPANFRDFSFYRKEKQHSMNYTYLTLLVAALAFSSCRLDNFMFNPTTVDEYLLENASEENPSFVLDDTYDIPQNKIELFSLKSGGETIYAVYLGDRARIAQDTVIVYCHGNAGNLDFYWKRAKLLANLGGKNRYGVLMMDYRGYGKSTGQSTEASIYEDVNNCMIWLKDQGLTDERTIIYGFSLGGVPSVQLTANPRSLQPSAIILEAAFGSFDALVQDATELSMPGSFFGSLEMANAEVIKDVEEPLLWMHGTADDFIPYTNGENIANNYRGRKLLKRPIVGGGHGSVPPAMGIEAYSKMVFDFISKGQ